MTRHFRFWAIFAVLCSTAALAQNPPKPPVQQQEQEPPEEDADLKPKEYEFNPLQAEKELRVGNYYFKKGSFKAAANRFREATRWNPNFAEAFYRLGEAEEKLRNRKGAHDAFARYLELAPDSKDAANARRRLAKTP